MNNSHKKNQSLYLIYDENLQNSKTWKTKFIKIIKALIKNIKTDKSRINTALEIEHVFPSNKKNHINVIPRDTRTYYTVPKQFVVTKKYIQNRIIRKYIVPRQPFIQNILLKIPYNLTSSS